MAFGTHMNHLLLIGLNHTTAPVELRECLAFSEEDTADSLGRLKALDPIKEALLVSTCNRVEVLVVTDDQAAAHDSVKTFMAESNGIPVTQFADALYSFEGDQAVRHVFRVAASLDSMMVGEPQILGQIKNAYRLATAQNTSGVILNRLLHRAFFVAKRVRSETGIGDHAVSISYAAVELSRKIFDTLEHKKVLLVGAGEMAELAIEHLMRHKVDRIMVANRTFERGVALADRFKGEAIRFDELMSVLEHVDIVVSSTGATDLVITRRQVKKMMRTRRNRPLFFIDIAVPRDIDPAINRIDNCYVYDIDDLKVVIEDNIEDRNREALKGERIVDEAVIRFREWYQSLDVVPTIVSLRQKLETIAQKEIKKTLSGLEHLAESDRQALSKMSQALVNKFLHDPTLFLKSDGCQREKAAYIDIARKLFNLDDD